jgi:hypothetical protein
MSGGVRGGGDEPPPTRLSVNPRIDPLPHQHEAVYHYFLKLPRIRFLLADDPGAEIGRVPIAAPANLCFRWQRELTDEFREQFEIVWSDALSSNFGQNPWQERDQPITSVL